MNSDPHTYPERGYVSQNGNAHAFLAYLGTVEAGWSIPVSARLGWKKWMGKSRKEKKFWQ